MRAFFRRSAYNLQAFICERTFCGKERMKRRAQYFQSVYRKILVVVIIFVRKFEPKYLDLYNDYMIYVYSDKWQIEKWCIPAASAKWYKYNIRKFHHFRLFALLSVNLDDRCLFIHFFPFVFANFSFSEWDVSELSTFIKC